MRLWSMQPKEVYDIIMNTGEFFCNNEKCENLPDFKEAYDWLVNQMDKRGIFHPEGITYPVWAWHSYDWKNEKPPIAEIFNGMHGEHVLMEIELDDSDVLLSDYNDWHSVLNKWYNDNSTNKEEWEAEQEYFDNLPAKEKNKIMLESWERIFDMTLVNTEWRHKWRYVQATFWKIKKENIKHVDFLSL